MKDADGVSLNSQITLFEVQLCRSLKKSSELVAESFFKYITSYAGVPPGLVLPVLFNAAQKEAKKHTPA